MSANDDIDLLAAEYVIGTLDGGERTAFAARLDGEEPVQRSVAYWERRLAPLQEAVDPVAPPLQLWSRIDDALNAASRPAIATVSGGRDAVGQPRDAFAALRHSRNRWRQGAAVLGAAVAVLLAFVVVHDLIGAGRGDADPVFVAAVNRGGDRPALIVRVDMRTRQVLVRPVAAQPPEGRSLELWYIAGGAAPRSLGLVSRAAEHRVVPAGARVDDAATFAVSVEPPGGSPTGGPTGAVLYSGQLVRE